MRERDKAIVADLQRFRVMTRDDIAELHFQGVKNPTTQANMVLKRLTRDGHIDVSKDCRMYRYYPVPGIKKNSTKTPHFLAIVDFYKQLIEIEEPRLFVVEPKYGCDFMEPDVFMIWQRAPFFVEIQNNVYSNKVMNAKMQRYEKYFDSREWEREPWQPEHKKIFPRVWMITDHQYQVGDVPFKLMQSKTVQEIFAETNNRK